MSDYFLLKLEGQRESVFEDLVKYEIYGDDLARLYDIHLTAGLGNGKGKKWSSKLSEILIKNGKLGNNTELVSAKNIVADTIVEHGLDSLKPAGRKVIEDLASKLESRFD